MSHCLNLKDFFKKTFKILCNNLLGRSSERALCNKYDHGGQEEDMGQGSGQTGYIEVLVVGGG